MCCLMIVYIDSMFKIHNLRHPYETNCTDHAIEHLPGYTKYTTSACILSCHSKYLVEKCGCRDVKILGKYRLVELEHRHRQKKKQKNKNIGNCKDIESSTNSNENTNRNNRNSNHNKTNNQNKNSNTEQRL